MSTPKNSRLRWLLGIASAWTGIWFLLALRLALQVRGEKPHPFLPQFELNGTIKRAIVEWVLSALLVYVVVGLVLGLIAKLFASDRHGTNLKEHLTYTSGFLTGCGTLLFFHGVLFVMVPMGMVGLPVLKHLPMGLDFLLILGGGALLLWRMYRRESPNLPAVRLLAFLGFLILLPQVPHDLLRKSLPLPPPLPPDAPRVLVVGIDGVRQDLFEKHMPAWKAPGGVHPVGVAPATRRSWSMLLGKEPATLRNSIIMPFQSDLGHPEEFKLLALAREKGLRTAWAIDDSLTAGFGNQPNWFTTVRESPGGWKYWFTFGYGTTFPVFAWSQNYIAPIENTNPWSDIRAYWRDVARLARTHHWTFTHTCILHEPIRMNLGEIQTFRPWRWLLDPPRAYRPYQSPDDVASDQASRADMRSSGLAHYSVRLNRVLKSLEPMIQDWEKAYPHLSGLVTSDHGEVHLQVQEEDGTVLTYMEGHHGFKLDPFSMWVPMHPFGKTRTRANDKQIFTWIELRDAMWAAGQSGDDLLLEGRSDPLLVQFPTIRAVFLETEEEKKIKADTGIDPRELLTDLYVFPNGLWFASDANDEKYKNRKLSSGLARGSELILFNPTDGGKFERQTFERYRQTSHADVSPEAVDAELSAYLRYLPLPLTLPVQSPEGQGRNASKSP